MLKNGSVVLPIKFLNLNVLIKLENMLTQYFSLFVCCNLQDMIVLITVIHPSYFFGVKNRWGHGSWKW